MAKKGTGIPSSEQSQPSSAPYEVGYGRPPATTQFKKGLSGNPRGRPKGARNKITESDLLEMILEEGKRTVTVQEPNGPATIPIVRAIVRAVNYAAVKGNSAAQRLSVEMTRYAQEQKWKWAADYYLGWARYKDFVESSNAQCAAWGEPPLDILPHPDHVILNPRAGTVRIIGPMTQEEQVAWDGVRKLALVINDDIEGMESFILENRNSNRVFARTSNLKGSGSPE